MAFCGVGDRKDVAIDDNGKRRRFDDRANTAPVGRACEELAARAAVDGNELDALSLGAACEFGGVSRLVVPA